MKTRPKIIIAAIMLLLSTLNYSRIIGNENIRTVQFLSIFAIGLISGVLIKLLIEAFKSR